MMSDGHETNTDSFNSDKHSYIHDYGVGPFFIKALFTFDLQDGTKEPPATVNLNITLAVKHKIHGS